MFPDTIHIDSQILMANTVTIRPVRSKSDERIFINFPWQIYKDYPYWVPPLKMDRRKLIDRKHNPFYQHAAMEMFLAERNGEVVGRIAAIVNENHNREHNEKMGFFGFFESIKDQDVTNALLDAAKAWLREKGMSAMRGPVSPSVNDELGLLVDGFDRLPAVLMPYNPPFYLGLLEKYGLRKVKDLFAFQVFRDDAVTDRLKRVSDSVKEKTGFSLRAINMKKFDEEVAVVHELYTRGWERNWGEVPLTDDEFKHMAKDLKMIVDPSLVIIAELNGKPIGFAMSVPDINEVLWHNKHGWILPAAFRLGFLKKRIKSIRIIILGVIPEYQPSGAGVVLFYETAVRAIAAGYPYGEASWVLEDNIMMNRGAELLNGKKTKTYRLLQVDI